jgi:DNA-binding NarL/FixJ family response regulator
MFNTNKKITAAIIDDHPIVAEGLQKILQLEFNAENILQFNAGDDFINYLQIKKAHIDLIFLDITLPGKSGMEVCKAIKILLPESRILAFSNHTERSIIMQMLQNGAIGYILKNASAAEINACIKSALNGQIVFSKEVNDIITKPAAGALNTIPSLTKREKEILRMITEGKTSTEMAEELFVSPLTVETHRRNLMQKFEVKNVAALVKLALELKLI